jgi:exopolyphosphatase/guanosine-5'-triphosphate,3'-diphosphate pyrophosphatase
MTASPGGPVAAIDCGTNSIRLLVAEPVEPGADGQFIALRDLDRQMRIVRLGQGVDRTGRLDPDALERTFATLRDYAERIGELGATATRMVATSASRDASNAETFVSGVREILGVAPEVISGDEEAALSYRGATAGVSPELAPSPRLVIDIGGGSTELVLGEGPRVVAARSVDVGCVRMTERHLADDPPSAQQVAATVADVDAAIALAGETVPLERARSLVGLAGSVTTVAAIHLGLAEYDPEAIHGHVVPAAAVASISDDLLRMTRAERGAIGAMHPGRIDVIAAGALVLRRITEVTGLPSVVVSEHDILDGIAWSLIE